MARYLKRTSHTLRTKALNQSHGNATFRGNIWLNVAVFCVGAFVTGHVYLFSHLVGQQQLLVNATMSLPGCKLNVSWQGLRGQQDFRTLLTVQDESCTAWGMGNIYYNQRNWPTAITLYEDGLQKGETTTAGESSKASMCMVLLRLSLCYYNLKVFDAAQVYAQKALHRKCRAEVAYDLGRSHEVIQEMWSALYYYTLACRLPCAGAATLQRLRRIRRRTLWPWQFPNEYLNELKAAQLLLDDPYVSDETEAQVHWEVVQRARPLLDAGREPFHREGIFQNEGRYYYATPSVVSANLNGQDEYLVLARLLNYQIDHEGRYYKNHLPVNDTSGTLHSSAALFIGVNSEPRELIVDNGQLKRKAYKFMGMEDPRLFQGADGNFLVMWTSWEYAEYVGEGSRAVLGRLDLNTATVRVQHVFPSPLNRFLEKNWVLFQIPGGPLQCVYEWYPLTIGTLHVNGSNTASIFLGERIPTPRSFRHIRGSSNGVNHRGELWFLVHGTSWHRGPGPVYYHRFVVLDPQTFALKRCTYPFKLEEAEAAVEFSLGMTIEQGLDPGVTIAYSVYDGSTVLRRIDMWTIDQLMIPTGRGKGILGL